MNGSYETKINIISSFLESCKEGRKSSHLINKFGFSRTQYKFYSDFLLYKEFIFIDREGLLNVTKKGKYFLDRLFN